jgi:hypothetical protein
MAFSSFSMTSALEQFRLSMVSRPLFQNVPAMDIGPGLKRTLDTFVQLGLGINTEKARSEWLIAPVIGEVWARGRDEIYVLSGVEFTVDPEEGLTGVVDFMIGRGPQVSFVPASPLLAVVEAKNESIPGGQGQCLAEMVAAQRFNQKRKTQIDTVYGAVTNGTSWKFHRLAGTDLVVDTREYLISEADKILGILMYIVGLNPIVPNGE